MKAILTTFAIAALALIGAAPEAQARHPHQHSNRVYISGHRSCGTPVYSERYFIGYDRCGEPVWGVRPVRESCYRQVVEPRFAAPCPPPYQPPSRDSYSDYDRSYSDCDRGYSGGRVVIQGSYGR